MLLVSPHPNARPTLCLVANSLKPDYKLSHFSPRGTTRLTLDGFL
jgi:hypothetical protein